MEKVKERKIITDKLVTEKTGKTLEFWFHILDKKHAKKMSHSEIYDLVRDIEGLKALGQWNQNLLTTSYEWSRGLKERGQKEKGYEVSVSKVIEVPVNILYNAWTDNKIRDEWLSDSKLVFRKMTENKSLVITWTDCTTVRVELYKKNENKSQIVVQHMKISDFEIAEKMRTFWIHSLIKLKTLLEAKENIPD